MIESLHTRLNNPEVDALTNAKKILEDKIQKQKYAYVSKHKANFDDVEDKFDKLNQFLADSCKAANEHAADLFFL